MRISKSTSVCLTAAAGAALAIAAFAAVPASVSAASAQVYRAVPVCAAPKAHHASCFAMKLKKVAAGTAGARRLTANSSYTTGPAGGFTPNDLAKAYGVSNTAPITNQVVGIVDAYDDPNALADLNAFDSHYGLPAETSTSFRKVSQTGSTTTLPTADAGWAGEESLDLDAVRGLCNNCKIILVEANSSAFTDLAAAENKAVSLGATEITNSYGGAESGAIDSSIASAYKHSGVVITASTGDHGLFDWDNYNVGGTSSSAPSVPSSLNTVVAVGGTTLYLNSDATRSGETVWNENGSSDVAGANTQYSLGASGGGCSTQVAAQKWQRSVSGYSQTGCGTFRDAGDIAALADPYTGYDIYDTYQSSGWATYGGTSLASPLIAAMWALAGGSGGVAYPSLSLYGHQKSAATTSLFDVTSGGNGICDGTPAGACASYLFGGTSPNAEGYGVLDCAWNNAGTALNPAGTKECDAATGYDGPSGVGAPKGSSVFKPMSPTAVITPPTTITHATSASFSASSSTDPFPGGSISSYAWTFGDGTSTTTTTSSTVTHTYAAAGSFTVTLKVTDNYSRSATTSTTVTVH